MADVKFSLNIPAELRSELDDVSFLLKVDAKVIVIKGIGAALESIKNKKGTKFHEALELLKKVRAEGIE